MSADEVVAAVVAGVCGLGVGSFAAVVADRVPRDESIVRPASHCDACGTPVRPLDNLPIVSYLVLRGRCRSCGNRIPPHVLLLEAVTAGLFVLFAFRLPTLWALPAFCAAGAGLVALSEIDRATHRLPRAVVYWASGVTVPLLVAAAGVTGDWNRLADAAIGAAACFAGFFVVFFVVPKGMGFGDVRLAAFCGGLLGFVGLRVIPIGLLAAFLLAGLPAIALVVVGKATRRTRVAFGPFLAAGSVIGICFGPAIVRALGLF